MSDNKQSPLMATKDLPPVTEEKQPLLKPESSIKAALGLFETHMNEKGFSLNTVKAFVSDVRLLGKYLGIGQPIGEIGTKDLNDFLQWLRDGRDKGIPCSNKSYARRVTTLKVFFGWLHEIHVLPNDPANAVIQITVKTPLPVLPTEEQIEKAIAVTQTIRMGEEDDKPDARPHLLLTLLLQTGIKKGEAMSIIPNHIDGENPEQPLLFVRYANPRLRYKERKLYLEAEWLGTLDEYLAQYDPPDTLFTCTARNLEYILRDVSDAAGLERGLLSFENLRWISALRDWNAKTEPDEIRQKLGLSKVTWRETKSKLTQLASQTETER